MSQQVTLDFTTYLRKNFTTLASEEPIPFSEELEIMCGGKMEIESQDGGGTIVTVTIPDRNAETS